MYHVISGGQPEIFNGRGGFLKLGHFDKAEMGLHSRKLYGFLS